MNRIPIITHGDDVAYRPVFYTQREVAYMRERWDRDVRAEYRRNRVKHGLIGTLVGSVLGYLFSLFV
jgi:hypothetical protein